MIRKLRFNLVWVLSFGFLATGFCSTDAKQSNQRGEYAIKAAFLFNFPQFIEWPREAAAPEGKPIRIGVIRPSPFGNILEEIAPDETMENRPIEVVYLDDVDDVENLHILFIPGREREAQLQAIERLGNRPILLISEDILFVQAGGMISLVREQEKVAIFLNRESLERANLSASSRLLRLAKTVEKPVQE